MNAEPPDVDLAPIVNRATHARSSDRYSQTRRWAVPLLAVVAAAAVSLAITTSVGQTSDQKVKTKTATVKAKDATADAQTNRDAATTIADEVLRACNTPGPTARALRKKGLCSTAVDTKQIAATTTTTTKTIVQTIPQSEIETAVGAYCARTGACGKDPTPAQVVAAVSTYCDARGQCRGDTGAPSTVQGPGPSADQIVDGLATYCAAHGECRGPSGADGANGTDGVDGANAYPFAFQFVVPGALGDQTYTCSVSSPTDLGTCTTT